MKSFLLNENKQITGVRILNIFNFLGWAQLRGEISSILNIDKIGLLWCHSHIELRLIEVEVKVIGMVLLHLEVNLTLFLWLIILIL